MAQYVVLTKLKLRYCTETITYLGSKVWSNIPDEIRESASLLETFRQKNQDSCPGHICKKYIANFGFVDLSLIPIG